MIQAEPITAKELFESMVEVPVDNTCRTCRFWNPPIQESLAIQPVARCENSNVWFTVKEESIHPFAAFGCRFHQPKEEQNG